MGAHSHRSNCTDLRSPIFQVWNQNPVREWSNLFLESNYHYSEYFWISLTLFVRSNKIYPLGSDHQGKSTHHFRIFNQVSASDWDLWSFWKRSCDLTAEVCQQLWLVAFALAFEASYWWFRWELFGRQLYSKIDFCCIIQYCLFEAFLALKPCLTSKGWLCCCLGCTDLACFRR